MATYVAKKAGLKLFEKHLQRYEPANPLYETYTDKNGRQKRRKVHPCNHRIGRFHTPRIIRLTEIDFLVSSAKPLLVYRSGTPASLSPSKGAPIASTPASIFAASGSGGLSS